MKKFIGINNEKLISLIVLIMTVISLLFMFKLYISKSEANSVTYYSTAIKTYKEGDFKTAYSQFSKISKFSNLKRAALYRQAKCAINMKQEKNAIKLYKLLLKDHADSSLKAICEYQLAQTYYNIGELKNAQKHFIKVLKKHPESEYAIASKYYLAKIILNDIDNTKISKRALTLNFATNYLKDYIKNAPIGRHAKDAIITLTNTDVNISPHDNLIIAESLYQMGNYESAKTYLEKTTLADSWALRVKNYSALKDFSKVKYYIETALPKYHNNTDKKQLYSAIDEYLKLPGANPAYINALTQGKIDYAAYLTCNASSANIKNACFNTFYYKFPDGQFSADALFNLFISKIKNKKYSEAQNLGNEHLKKFPTSNSAPAVMYWLGLLQEKNHHYENAKSYYRSVQSRYPNDYYAYRAELKLSPKTTPTYKNTLKYKPVVFPYKKSANGDFVLKLSILKDYDLVSEICKNDRFVQSWIEYEKGNYTTSAVIARNAIEEMAQKPSKDDLRWRLAYPIHYYQEIVENARGNNPVLMLALLKEESHFNPNAESVAGARGLMQIMPKTADETMRNLGLKIPSNDYLFNPLLNIKVGNAYYASLRTVLKNKNTLAVMAYNGGIGSVKRWQNAISTEDLDTFIENIPYPETKNYIKKVYKTYWNYARLY